MTMNPPKVYVSPLTGRAYFTNNYSESVARTKVDVTDSVVHELMALAWARGWNECNEAEPGTAPPNPYRPGGTDAGE